MRGSFCCDGACKLHIEHFVLMNLMSASIPGQHTKCRALRNIESTPWWPECRELGTISRMLPGTTNRMCPLSKAYLTNPLIMPNLSRT